MKLRKLIKIPEGQYTIRELSRWLWHALQGNRLQACLNAGIGLVGVVLSLLTVWAMQYAIDIASGTIPGSIYLAVGFMAMLILGEFAVGISRVWIRNILGVKAQNRMQQHLMKCLLQAEWRGRDAMHSGDVVNRLEEDVRQVCVFLTETLPSVLSTLALFIGAFAYMLRMDVWLACITVAVLPIFVVLSRYYVAHMRRYSRKVRQSDSDIQSLLTETMQHQMLVKTMEADRLLLDRLGQEQQTLRGWVRRRTVFSVASHLFINFGFAFGYLVAFLWGALRLHAGTLTFGGMTAFLQLVYRIQGPARDLSRLAPAFVSVFTAAERLMELEYTPKEEQGDPIKLEGPCGIEISDVNFTYSSSDKGETLSQPPTLSHFSATFKPSTCTAVMGPTGSGKTTLIRLILALVKPDSGHIRIYNNDAREDLTVLHRCNFVYVPQGNTLLSGTLRQNLLLANPQATDDDMHQALQTACADFVFSLPNGLDSSVSELGGGLSEGQAQRISIARALLRPGSILLLDEATSALDAETEQRVLNNLLADGSQRTVIVITHREAAIAYCQHVVRV